MKFIEIPLDCSYIIEIEKNEDNRGFFARTFDKNEFFHKYINFDIVQTSISYNKKKGTLRGMHYQDIPYPEEKIVQCVKGSIYDVVLDLRSYSKTYWKWFSIELNDRNNKVLYIPIGVAHGFQTLEDDTIVLYYMNQEYHPECSKTIPYSDTRCKIEWKLPITSISDKDKENL